MFFYSLRLDTEYLRLDTECFRLDTEYLRLDTECFRFTPRKALLVAVLRVPKYLNLLNL